eukprot:scpid102395/ scgid9499/ Protein trachealess
MEAEADQSEETASANGAQETCISNEPKEREDQEGEGGSGTDEELRRKRIQLAAAAVTRRGREHAEITKMAEQLPLTSDASDNLDKTGVLRLALSVMQIGAISGKGPFRENDSQSPEEESEASGTLQPAEKPTRKPTIKVTPSSAMLSARGEFQMIISSNGRICYCSPNVESLLGVRDVEV